MPDRHAFIESTSTSLKPGYLTLEGAGQHTATDSTPLQHTTTHCTTLHHTATPPHLRSEHRESLHTPQHTTAHCNTLQYTATHPAVLHREEPCEEAQPTMLQVDMGVAVCCIVLQCVAVCCRVLQGVAACCSVLECVTV